MYHLPDLGTYSARVGSFPNSTTLRSSTFSRSEPPRTRIAIGSQIFPHNAFFIGPNVRNSVNEGCSDYTPIHLSEVPRLIRRRQIHLHLALSLGVSVDIVTAAVENADYVLAEVNSNMPRTLGDSFIYRSRIHSMVASDLPILEFVAPQCSSEAKQIGELIASLVENSSTLQTGIGEIPSAVVAALEGNRDLGMHTEMFTAAITFVGEEWDSFSHCTTFEGRCRSGHGAC